MAEQELRNFYKGRFKKPKEYTYSPDGNMIRLDKDGGIKASIVLPNYRGDSGRRGQV